jgi:hypothetical protein
MTVCICIHMHVYERERERERERESAHVLVTCRELEIWVEGLQAADVNLCSRVSNCNKARKEWALWGILNLVRWIMRHECECTELRSWRWRALTYRRRSRRIPVRDQGVSCEVGERERERER